MSKPGNHHHKKCRHIHTELNIQHYPAASLFKQKRIRFPQIVLERRYGQKLHSTISSPLNNCWSIYHWTSRMAPGQGQQVKPSSLVLWVTGGQEGREHLVALRGDRCSPLTQASPTHRTGGSMQELHRPGCPCPDPWAASKPNSSDSVPSGCSALVGLIGTVPGPGSELLLPRPVGACHHGYIRHFLKVH